MNLAGYLKIAADSKRNGGGELIQVKKILESYVGGFWSFLTRTRYTAIQRILKQLASNSLDLATLITQLADLAVGGNPRGDYRQALAAIFVIVDPAYRGPLAAIEVDLRDTHGCFKIDSQLTENYSWRSQDVKTILGELGYGPSTVTVQTSSAVGAGGRRQPFVVPLAVPLQTAALQTITASALALSSGSTATIQVSALPSAALDPSLFAASAAFDRSLLVAPAAFDRGLLVEPAAFDVTSFVPPAHHRVSSASFHAPLLPRSPAHSMGGDSLEHPLPQVLGSGAQAVDMPYTRFSFFPENARPFPVIGQGLGSVDLHPALTAAEPGLPRYAAEAEEARRAGEAAAAADMLTQQALFQGTLAASMMMLM